MAGTLVELAVYLNGEFSEPWCLVGQPDAALWATFLPRSERAPDGDAIGHIALPECCASVCFGGAAQNRLFMAAGQSPYALYVGATAAVVSVRA
jgi:hypothetical protein